MSQDKGGIKTSIFLFGVLFAITLLLFLFVQTIYLENKQTATSGLSKVNNCIDLIFDISNEKQTEQGIEFTFTNRRDSSIISFVSINNQFDKTIEVEGEILPGQSKKILAQGFMFPINIYPDNCKSIQKIIA